MRDNVRGLTVVLPDGAVMHTGGSASGAGGWVAGRQCVRFCVLVLHINSLSIQLARFLASCCCRPAGAQVICRLRPACAVHRGGGEAGVSFLNSPTWELLSESKLTNFAQKLAAPEEAGSRCVLARVGQ